MTCQNLTYNYFEEKSKEAEELNGKLFIQISKLEKQVKIFSDFDKMFMGDKLGCETYSKKEELFDSYLDLYKKITLDFHNQTKEIRLTMDILGKYILNDKTRLTINKAQILRSKIKKEFG